jgi:hypothetical protein
MGRSCAQDEQSALFLGGSAFDEEEEGLQDGVVEPPPDGRELDESLDVVDEDAGGGGAVGVVEDLGHDAYLLALGESHHVLGRDDLEVSEVGLAAEVDGEQGLASPRLPVEEDAALGVRAALLDVAHAVESLHDAVEDGPVVDYLLAEVGAELLLVHAELRPHLLQRLQEVRHAHLQVLLVDDELLPEVQDVSLPTNGVGVGRFH